jgi:hypothetical protein
MEVAEDKNDRRIAMPEPIHREPSDPATLRAREKLMKEMAEEKAVIQQEGGLKTALARRAELIARNIQQHEPGRVKYEDSTIHKGAVQVAEPTAADKALAKKVAELGLASSVTGVAHDLGATEIKPSPAA